MLIPAVQTALCCFCCLQAFKKQENEQNKKKMEKETRQTSPASPAAGSSGRKVCKNFYLCLGPPHLITRRHNCTAFVYVYGVCVCVSPCRLQKMNGHHLSPARTSTLICFSLTFSPTRYPFPSHSRSLSLPVFLRDRRPIIVFGNQPCLWHFLRHAVTQAQLIP